MILIPGMVPGIFHMDTKDAEMTAIKFTDDNAQIHVETPYHPMFVEAARKFNGKWNSSKKAWTFDCRDRSHLELVCRTIYGTAGEPTPLVTIHIKLDDVTIVDGELYLLGRMIVQRRHRDVPVKLGEGVVIVKGEFSKYGGSMAHPKVAASFGTILEVRDVPLGLAYETLKDYPLAISAAPFH